MLFVYIRNPIIRYRQDFIFTMLLFQESVDDLFFRFRF